MCPNCNASMQEMKRDEVAFDMCPTCRGVWLDRGELEKLMESAKSERQEFARDRDEFYRDPDAYRRAHPKPHYDHDDDDHDRRGYDPRTGRRRRGGFDMFDIFD
jgi:Zn-finger nucleic acid-binding protein